MANRSSFLRFVPLQTRCYRGGDGLLLSPPNLRHEILLHARQVQRWGDEWVRARGNSHECRVLCWPALLPDALNKCDKRADDPPPGAREATSGCFVFLVNRTSTYHSVACYRCEGTAVYTKPNPGFHCRFREHTARRTENREVGNMEEARKSATASSRLTPTTVEATVPSTIVAPGSSVSAISVCHYH